MWPWVVKQAGIPVSAFTFSSSSYSLLSLTIQDLKLMDYMQNISLNIAFFLRHLLSAETGDANTCSYQYWQRSCHYHLRKVDRWGLVCSMPTLFTPGVLHKVC